MCEGWQKSHQQKFFVQITCDTQHISTTSTSLCIYPVHYHYLLYTNACPAVQRGKGHPVSSHCGTAAAGQQAADTNLPGLHHTKHTATQSCYKSPLVRVRNWDTFCLRSQPPPREWRLLQFDTGTAPTETGKKKACEEWIRLLIQRFILHWKSNPGLKMKLNSVFVPLKQIRMIHLSPYIKRDISLSLILFAESICIFFFLHQLHLKW